MDEFLDIARIEAGAIPLDIGPVNADDIVDEVARMSESLASESGTSIAVGRDGATILRADPVVTLCRARCSGPVIGPATACALEGGRNGSSRPMEQPTRNVVIDTSRSGAVTRERIVREPATHAAATARGTALPANGADLVAGPGARP